MPPVEVRARLRQRRPPRDAGDRRAHAARPGELPTPEAINDLLTSDFFLPFANKPAHKEMREKARRLVFKYVNEHQDDLLRTWATERPFELYLDGVVVSGRADVIYDEHDGVIDNLAIVDYKTSTGGDDRAAPAPGVRRRRPPRGSHRGRGLHPRHETTTRHAVAVGEPDVAAAEAAGGRRRRVAEAARLHAEARACEVPGVRRSSRVRCSSF